MKRPSSFPRLKGFRFPREVIAYAVWAYHRLAMSTADVEDFLAERGLQSRAFHQAHGSVKAVSEPETV